MTDRIRILLSVLACGLTLDLGGSQQSAAPASPPGGALTIERLLGIRHPGSAVWSPDARRIAFTWDRAGVQNIWTVDTQSATPAPQSVTSFDGGAIEELSWSRDGSSLRFARDGYPWEVAPTERSAPHAVWTTKEAESQFALSPDGTRLAFVRGGMPGVPDWQRVDGDLWVRRLADGRETRLTAGQGVVSARRGRPTVRASPSRSQRPRPEQKRQRTPAARSCTLAWITSPVPGLLSAAGGRITLLPPSPGWESAPWWLDSSRLLMQRIADDYRTRELLVADVNTGGVHTIYREVAPTFWSLGFIAPDPTPSPDGR